MHGVVLWLKVCFVWLLSKYSSSIYFTIRFGYSTQHQREKHQHNTHTQRGQCTRSLMKFFLFWLQWINVLFWKIIVSFLETTDKCTTCVRLLSLVYFLFLFNLCWTNNQRCHHLVLVKDVWIRMLWNCMKFYW